MSLAVVLLGTGRVEEALAAYDAALARYSKAHEMTQYTWTDRVLNSMGPIKSMSGRDKLKAALQALGFRLD